ncbi:uncharacterized protein LOC123194751 [Mangifera indica]|uniref:uncharacterized protein LOC123194751 n=1 Tax=Mangifera indica TaxID=29780 RepID=UPI001CFADD3A|nr:uncharacterized protein LOC123194751 [Mangifera indica]XP_044464068.1 uncharacterized protein LOC123194751 [Mangifera indica]XP_044464069.1 uncharacterized protein LOC123194751 [Mangifera indica]
MPKERRDRSVSFDRCRTSPYPCSSNHAQRFSAKTPSNIEEKLKEWEEARCSICMEHPHNAVLLLCSSHEKGCRPYMCDTSYRHSNCLDQFRKSFTDTSSETPRQEEMQPTSSVSVVTSELAVTDLLEERSEEGSLTPHSVSREKKAPPKIVCPLCRGQIKDWIVVEDARQFMNAKTRSCSCETCNFSGTYTDLRKHARLEHPLVRPSEADPERENNWRRLERQRDLGDLVSTLQSSFGEEGADSSISPIEYGDWLTVFFLIRVFRPGSRPSRSSFSATTRARAHLSIRRRSTRLWGESYDGEAGSSSRDDDNDSSDGGSAPLRRSARIRRQTTPDNQP